MNINQFFKAKYLGLHSLQMELLRVDRLRKFETSRELEKN